MEYELQLARCEDSETEFRIVAVDKYGNVIASLHTTPENFSRLGEQCRRAFPSKVASIAESVAS